MFDKIVRILDYDKDELDKVLFNKWKFRKISTEQCLKAFLKNNVGENDNLKKGITEEMFVSWLKTIGWERKEES